MAISHATATAIDHTGVGGANQVMMGFVPEIWTGRIIKALDDKLITGKLVNRDYQGDIKGPGDTVRVHMVGNINAKDYTIPANRGGALSSRGTITYQTATGGSIVFSVDKADYFGFEVEDIEEAQANPKYMAELSARAGVALAQATERYILKDMVAAAKSATADEFEQVGGSSALTNDVHPIDVQTANAAYEDLVDLAVLMDDNLAPEDGRYIIAPSFALANLRKDTRFVGAGADGAGKVRENGYIGSVAGFEIYTLSRKTFQDYTGGQQNTQVPNDTTTDQTSTDAGLFVGSDTADTYDGIAGVKEAYTFADAITKTESVRLEGSFANAVRGLHVYGGHALRPQWLFATRFTDSVASGAGVNPQDPA